MKTEKILQRDVIKFQNEYNHISPSDLDNIMESFNDLGYLSEEGVKFKSSFWELFIRKTHP